MSDEFDAAMGVTAPKAAASPSFNSDEIRAKIRARAAQLGIDPDMAERQAKQESGFDPRATSKKGAKGVFQLMDPTGKQYGVTDPYNVDQNIDGGLRYYADLRKKYGGDDSKALAAYNAGPDAVDKAGGVPNYPETQAYVKTIMGGGKKADDFDVVMTGAPTEQAPTAGGSQADAEAAYKAQFGDPSKFTGDIKYTGLDQKSTKQQTETFLTLKRGHALDEDAPLGSERNPYGLQPGVSPKDVPAGQYYVPFEGGLKRAPGGEDKSSMGEGAMRGVADVVQSVVPSANLGETGLKEYLKARQMIYDAGYKGDTASGFGRFLGQAGASAPLIAGGEAALAPILGATPVGAFLAGKGGMAMAPGLARLGVRGASLGASGAGEGAAASALTSSASDAPFSEQLATGAFAGGVLGPIAPAVAGVGKWAGRTVRGMTEPLTYGGREKMNNRLIGEFGKDAPMTPNAQEIIPGSVPTLSMATANPGIATLERTVRLLRPTPFAERDAANAEARGLVLDNVRGDEQTVADLVNTRQQVVDAARTRAFSQTRPADPAPLVQTLDDALAAPAAHMEDVARPLQAIRDKIVQAPPETTPGQLADFNRSVAKTFGADAPALTPEVLSEARSRLGSKFEEIAKNTEVKWDDALRSRIGEVIKNTADVLPDSQLPPLFRQLDNIASTAKEGGEITGASYQALTKRGSPLDSLMKSGDPTIRQAAGDIREALDDALERSLGAKGATGTVDKATGLPLNADGTVTVYHHTSPDAAAEIRKSGTLKSAAEPDVYVTTRKEADTGYGDTVVPVRVRPEKLKLDDEFPDGRRDFSIGAGKPGGSVPVQVGEDGGASALQDLRDARLQYKNLKTTEAALRSAGPDKQVTPQAVLSAVKRNFGQFAYKGGGPLGDAAEAAVKEQAGRAPKVETDPRQIYGMRESLSTAIDRLEAKGTDAAQLAANHLKGVRDKLDATIEGGAPGYREFVDVAERSAEPVAATKFLQSLRLTDARGKVTLARVDGALKRIADMRAKDGKNPAKSISDATMVQLAALKEDLLRESNVGLGRPIGSDTAQHLATGNISAGMDVPLALGAGALLHHPLAGPAVGVGKLFYGKKNEQMLDQLTTRLLDPQVPINVTPTPSPGKVSGPLRRIGRVAIPVAAGVLSNSLVGR